MGQMQQLPRGGPVAMALDSTTRRPRNADGRRRKYRIQRYIMQVKWTGYVVDLRGSKRGREGLPMLTYTPRAVPEPGTLVLVVTATGGLVVWRRRSRRPLASVEPSGRRGRDAGSNFRPV